ncbi:MAG TPA: RebB family R body protein [Allosphingosinicella sp.]|nr:RebB family R body protein [Allosphingosinicella sp.]
MDQGSVNGQIVDSVADVVTLNGGIAPTQAFGMLDSVMAETLGMAMYNAVSRQQGSSMIGSAATTAVCAKMLSAPFPFELPPAPPPPPPPPSGGIQPLDPPPPKPPKAAAAIIAAAKAEGEWAIDTLKTEEAGLASSAAAARDALEQLTADAAPSAAAGLIAGATAEAEASIQYLQSVANDPSSASQKAAQAQLADLAAAAKQAPPPPPPPPVDPVAEAGKAAAQAIGILQQQAAVAPDSADSANARSTLAELDTKATFTPPKK